MILTYKRLKEINAQELDETTEAGDVDLSSFELKTELNPDFWHDGELDRKVRRELLKIARDFIVDLEIEDLEIEDLVMTGSLANYNWSEKYSDIDLHIITDFEKIDASPEITKKFFDDERKSWNDKHEKIRIGNFPVEIYIQDTKERHTSSGVYSILNNKWIAEPSFEKIENKELDRDDIRARVAEFMNIIDELEEDFAECESIEDYDEIYNRATETFDEIKKTRQSSMEKSSREMSEGNIVFKALRRNGYIEKLIDIKIGSYDLMHSVDL